MALERRGRTTGTARRRDGGRFDPVVVEGVTNPSRRDPYRNVGEDQLASHNRRADVDPEFLKRFPQMPPDGEGGYWYNPETQNVEWKDESWWSKWGPLVITLAGVATGGIAGQAGLLGGAASAGAGAGGGIPVTAGLGSTVPGATVPIGSIVGNEIVRRGIMGNMATSTWLPAAINAAGGLSQGLLDEDADAPNVPFTGIADPQLQMEQFIKALTGYGRAATDLARQPITLSSASAVQPVAGTTGVDPAYSDPSLLTLPGLDLPDFFPDFGPVYDQPDRGEFTDPGGATSRPRGDNVPTGRAVPRPGSGGGGTATPPMAPPTSGTTRRALPGVAPSAGTPSPSGAPAPAPTPALGAAPPPSPGLTAESNLQRRLRSNSPLAGDQQAEGAVRLLMELFSPQSSTRRAA